MIDDHDNDYVNSKYQKDKPNPMTEHDQTRYFEVFLKIVEILSTFSQAIVDIYDNYDTNLMEMDMKNGIVLAF